MRGRGWGENGGGLGAGIMMGDPGGRRGSLDIARNFKAVGRRPIKKEGKAPLLSKLKRGLFLLFLHGSLE